VATADSFFVKWSPRLLSVLRIIAAFMLIQHGAQKLFGVPAAPPPPQQAAQQNAQQQPAAQKPSGMPPMMLVAGALELFGGLLFLFGLFTRPVAFLLSGELAVAYFTAHAPHGFWPLLNQGELAALYSFLFLYFAVAGGGEWSIDRVWRRDRHAREAVA
jgi:putative oxidoreductase